jgi:TonB family protein
MKSQLGHDSVILWQRNFPGFFLFRMHQKVYTLEAMHRPTITVVAGVIFSASILLSVLHCRQCYASDDADVSIRELAAQAKRKQIRRELMEVRPVPGTGEITEYEPVDWNPLTPFMKDLQERIIQRWRPIQGHERDYTVLAFKVFKNGNVAEIKVHHSSGTPDVDDAAIHAVKSAAPFSKVPSYSSEKFYEIQFTFPPPLVNDTGTKKSTFKGYI